MSMLTIYIDVRQTGCVHSAKVCQYPRMYKKAIHLLSLFSLPLFHVRVITCTTLSYTSPHSTTIYCYVCTMSCAPLSPKTTYRRPQNGCTPLFCFLHISLDASCSSSFSNRSTMPCTPPGSGAIYRRLQNGRTSPSSFWNHSTSPWVSQASRRRIAVR